MNVYRYDNPCHLKYLPEATRFSYTDSPWRETTGDFVQGASSRCSYWQWKIGIIGFEAQPCVRAPWSPQWSMTQVMGIPQSKLLSVARNSQVSVSSILLSYRRNIPKDLKTIPPLKYPFKCSRLIFQHSSVLWMENQVIFLTGKTNQSSFFPPNAID